MEINHKFDFVDGAFDTKAGKLICTTSDKYAKTKLCFKSNMHIPFAKIRLHSKDLFVDAKAVNEDAYKLGNEITKRWNMHDEMLEALKDIIKASENHELKKDSESLGVLYVSRMFVEELIKKASE